MSKAAIVERLRRYFPPPTQRTVAVEVALLQEAADHIEYQNWCMDRAIDLIESGREWDAGATLRAALGNGSYSTEVSPNETSN